MERKTTYRKNAVTRVLSLLLTMVMLFGILPKVTVSAASSAAEPAQTAPSSGTDDGPTV